MFMIQKVKYQSYYHNKQNYMYYNSKIPVNHLDFTRFQSNQGPFSLKIQQFSNTRSTQKNHHNISTSISTDHIDPIWHLISALDTIITPQLKRKKRQILQKIMSYSHKLETQFSNHCATIIQKNYKSYIQQKYYRKFLPIYRRFKSLLEAVVSGWRVRKIISSRNIQKKIQNIKQLQNNDDSIIDIIENAAISNGNKKKVRIMKRDLAFEIQQLQKMGKWVNVAKTKNSKQKVSTKQIKIKIALHAKNSTKQYAIDNNSHDKDYQQIENNNNLRNKQIQPRICQIAQQQRPIQASGTYNIGMNNTQQIQQDTINKTSTTKHKPNKNKNNKATTKKLNTIPITKQNNQQNIVNISANKQQHKIMQKTPTIIFKQQPQHAPANKLQQNNYVKNVDLNITTKSVVIDQFCTSIHLPADQQQHLQVQMQWLNKTKKIVYRQKQDRINQLMNSGNFQGVSNQQLQLTGNTIKMHKNINNKNRKGLKVTMLETHNLSEHGKKGYNQNHILLSAQNTKPEVLQYFQANFSYQQSSQFTNKSNSNKGAQNYQHSYPQWNSKYPESITVTKQVLERYGHDSIMREILQVYSGAYCQKRHELQTKLQQIRKQRSHNRYCTQHYLLNNNIPIFHTN